MANTSTNSGMRRKNPTSASGNESASVERIRSRAYAVYESRGKEDGHDLEDWLVAEKQVTDKRQNGA